MKPEIIRDYLQRAEMTEAQSTALSHILGEMATRGDVLRLEDRMRSFEERMDQKFNAFEVRTDDRFGAFEERMDERFRAYEERMDRKLSDMQSEMTWKIVALVSLIVTIGTALNILVG